MNLLIYSTAQQQGKLLLNSNFSSAATVASGLGYSEYLISIYTKTVIVNDANGTGFQAYLTGTTQNNLTIFDVDEAAAISYIQTNYPSETIVNFGKNNITVQ
jgi:hypothetical protein